MHSTVTQCVTSQTARFVRGAGGRLDGGRTGRLHGRRGTTRRPHKQTEAAGLALPLHVPRPALELAARLQYTRESTRSTAPCTATSSGTRCSAVVYT